MESASFYTEKAAQCRRLAASITDDRAVKVLSAMAEEFEELAGNYAAREKSAQRLLIGLVLRLAIPVK
jgi:hypothetical protein